MWLTLLSWFKQSWGGQGECGRTSAKGLVPVSLYMFRWGVSTLIFWRRRRMRRRTHLFEAMQPRVAGGWNWSSELCRGPQWTKRRCSRMEDMHHREGEVSEGSPERDWEVRKSAVLRFSPFASDRLLWALTHMATSCCGEGSLWVGRKGGKQRAESCAVCLSDFPQKVVGGPKNRECELINPN